MDYQASFFQLHLHFAKEIARAKALEFFQALLEYSPIFRLIGADESLWNGYLEGLASSENQAAFTADFVREHRFVPGREHFGCFAYAIEENDTRLRIHFDNIEGKGALSKERVEARQAEIKAMIANAKAKYPQLESIRGGSWLYNLDAYKRLFPPKIIAELYVQEEEFQFLSLWGQCLLASGEANPQSNAYILQKAALLKAGDDIQNCFPYQVLGYVSKLSDFEGFYQ
jgi:hypothetical protein